MSVPEGMYDLVDKGRGELEANTEKTRGIIGAWYPVSGVVRGLRLGAKYGESVFVDQNFRPTTAKR